MLTKSTAKIKLKYILLALFSVVFIPHLFFIKKNDLSLKGKSAQADPRILYALVENDVLYENAATTYAKAFRASSNKPRALYTNIFYGYMGANNRVVKTLKIYRLKNNSSLFRFYLPTSDPKPFKTFIDDLRRPLSIFEQALVPSRQDTFKKSFNSLEKKLTKYGRSDPKLQSFINEYNSPPNSHYYYATSDVLNNTFLKDQDHTHIFFRIIKLNNFLNYILQRYQSQSLYKLQKELTPFINQAFKVQKAFLKTRELLAPYIWHAFQEGRPTYSWLRKNNQHIFNFKFIDENSANKILNERLTSNELRQSYLSFLLKIQLPIIAIFLVFITFLGLKGYVSSE